jgi:DNA mismatch repair ATPase MutS
MAELSLLWPHGQPTPTWSISNETIRDLELEAIAQAMCTHSSYREAVRAVLFHLCQDQETIRYRQIVFADLQAQPALAQKIRTLLPLLDELTQFTYRSTGRRNQLQEVVARARELELLLETVQQLHAAFAAVSSPLQSAGLSALSDKVTALVGNLQFQELTKDLPGLLEALRTHASVTIGVNLDDHLRPEAAVLLAVNKKRFSDNTLLDRLLGKDTGQGKGLAPLHKPPLLGDNRSQASGIRQQRLDPLMVPLFKDLSKVLEKVSAPVAQELKKYVQLNGRFLADLRPELIFYTQALDLIDKLRAAGMSLTYPEIALVEERICRVQAAYNLQLAMQKLQHHADRPPVVSNDITFDDDGRIAILTGPNRGGKTTYMQSAGLVQVLAQTGMPVPGEAARISPVDAIYTHYPLEERLELGTGRFGDEARRIRAIFEKMTRHSLVLFNESLSTTSMGEGIYLARDIVRALRQIGLRVVFTTHMHELAATAQAINTETFGDSAVFSLVASKPDQELQPDQGYSYRIKPGPPLGRSYAEHIAAQYGISDEQLQSLITSRFLTGEKPPENE